MAGMADLGPDAATEEGQARARKRVDSTAALTQYMSDLINRYLKEPGESLLSKLVNDSDGPDGAMAPKEAAANGMRSWSPGTTRRSTPSRIVRRRSCAIRNS